MERMRAKMKAQLNLPKITADQTEFSCSTNETQAKSNDEIKSIEEVNEPEEHKSAEQNKSGENEDANAPVLDRLASKKSTSSKTNMIRNSLMGNKLESENNTFWMSPKSNMSAPDHVMSDEAKDSFGTMSRFHSEQSKPSMRQFDEDDPAYGRNDIFLISGNFKDFYDEKETLGQGVSAVVKRCLNRITKEEFAVKVVNYNKDDELELLLKKEFIFRRELDHVNVVKVYEMYIDPLKGKIYTIMEIVKGKEMFDVIETIGHYSEEMASGIFKQVLIGIQYLHRKGVCHRDLKPHNIIISGDANVVKITDFNVSKFNGGEKKLEYTALSSENYKMWTFTGTVAYTAPEVFLDLEYTEAVDMWSAGCVLYMMLCGYQPFRADLLPDLIEEIKEGKVVFIEEDW
eukprot:CAMPEP_0176458890 /NCGR_PEP_ID=MMETSP0127-20121128/32895_1 /TAXON_ID=938130 /ORGANISM="Platyophrya macrostoma, Strain WH" /LENGTH=400 /DNA_ID=CAMNT_0017849611 /DNA_START=236 /DNA_END=1435 /DNA_ORIENTATION=-